jgi:predicted XRE-type DNA-binding protein
VVRDTSVFEHWRVPLSADYSGRQRESRNPDYGDYSIKHLTNEGINPERLENYISQVEAARIVGITKQSMTNLVRRGYFNTQRVAGRILILRAEAEALGSRHRGRPRKEVVRKKKTLTKPTERTHKKDSEKYISQAEAARIRGVSQPSIADLIRRGRLTRVSIAGRTLLLRAEVEAFEPQPVGHPPKKKPNTKTPQQKKSKK